MLLKKIKLENIRSYLNQEIDFPLGSTLLSGDIGSGKSSILLAIDFALFGLQKDTLSGNSLLRNGKNKGSAELHFTIDGKDIVIKRTLKRIKNSVVQDAGYIIIGKEKKELTPVELKQLTLLILNYPKELLTKTKTLIYRYTVYTPQEEMKHILILDRASRIDILRKVFNIDRYKRIMENARIYSSHVKKRKSDLAEKIADLDEKLKQSEEKENNIKTIEVRLSKAQEDLAISKKILVEKKNNIRAIESEIKNLNELKNKLGLLELDLKNKISQANGNEDAISEIEKFIHGLKKEIKPKAEASLKEKKKTKENEIQLMEATLKEILGRLSELKAKKNNSEALKKGILNLDTCPVCKQKVGEEHKRNIIANEDKSLLELNKALNLFLERQAEAEKKLKDLKGELEKLRRDEHSAEISKLKLLSLKEKENSREKLIRQQLAIKSEIKNISTKKEQLCSEIRQFKDVEKKFVNAKEELESAMEKEKEIEIRNATLFKELNYEKEIYTNMRKEIDEKVKIKSEIEYLSQLLYWIDNNFTNIITAVEKNIMIKVYTDFNSFFEKWFDILMDNELLKIRLDEEFTPIIQQDGHDIEYEYLSGGEKTAAALAYRLALNQIINNLSNIKTKDLIILDEPTDGFSNEQLDRMKFVLDELNTKQIIVVSHDPKIESFVSSVIRLNKREHITEIL